MSTTLATVTTTTLPTLGLVFVLILEIEYKVLLDRQFYFTKRKNYPCFVKLKDSVAIRSRMCRFVLCGDLRKANIRDLTLKGEHIFIYYEQ